MPGTTCVAGWGKKVALTVSARGELVPQHYKQEGWGKVSVKKDRPM